MELDQKILEDLALQDFIVNKYGELVAYKGPVDVEVIVLSPYITSVRQKVFFRRTSLFRIEMPNVKIICVSSFEECSSLQEVEMPNVEVITASAFKNCYRLFRVSIPKIKNIYRSMFQNCGSLQEVNMPNVEKIFVSAFEGCSSLINMVMPKVKNICLGAFHGCSRLQCVMLPDGVLVPNDGVVFGECYRLSVIYCSKQTFDSLALNDARFRSIERKNLPSNGLKVMNLYLPPKGEQAARELWYCDPRSFRIDSPGYVRLNALISSDVRSSYKDMIFLVLLVAQRLEAESGLPQNNQAIWMPSELWYEVLSYLGFSEIEPGSLYSFYGEIKHPMSSRQLCVWHSKTFPSDASESESGEMVLTA